MRWYKDALLDIKRPYNLRAFFNQHETFVLDVGYKLFMDRITELEKVYTGSNLDISCLKHIREDIEDEKDKLIFRREQKEELSKNIFKEDDYESPLTNIKSDGIVEIRVIRKSGGNLLEAIEREAFVHLLKQTNNKSEISRLLGVSYRTVQKKIKKYFEENENADS